MPRDLFTALEVNKVSWKLMEVEASTSFNLDLRISVTFCYSVSKVKEIQSLPSERLRATNPQQRHQSDLLGAMLLLDHAQHWLEMDVGTNSCHRIIFSKLGKIALLSLSFVLCTSLFGYFLGIVAYSRWF